MIKINIKIKADKYLGIKQYLRFEHISPGIQHTFLAATCRATGQGIIISAASSSMHICVVQCRSPSHLIRPVYNERTHAPASAHASYMQPVQHCCCCYST
jgi:hypothetical protein